MDGVVEHYYINKTLSPFELNSDTVNFIDVDFGIWQDNFDVDLSLHITEWNVKSNNLHHLGLRTGVTMIEQFSFMLEIGVDEAYVWPPQHNTTNDLGGSSNVVVDYDFNYALNSVGGAVFSMLSSSLVGMELYSFSSNAEPENVEIRAFGSNEETVLFISSTSLAAQALSINLAGSNLSTPWMEAYKIGYDRSTSDGRMWDPTSRSWISADYVMIDGERYYLNEHDTQAEITRIETTLAIETGVLELNLLPFEVAKITVRHFDPSALSGTAGSDRIDGTTAADILMGLGGDDTLVGGDGNDTIEGGTGNDRMIGGRGDDVLRGQEGHDSIDGWGGDDEIFGGSGNDRLSGQQGNDLLDGGSGDDWIFGEIGDDTLNGGSGNDTLIGGTGADVLDGGDGTDLVSYAASRIGSRIDLMDDRLNNREALGDTFISIENLEGTLGGDNLRGTMQSNAIWGLDGVDWIFGRAGDDSLFGGQGNDVLLGGAGRDHLNGGEGRDRAQYSEAMEGVVADLLNPGQNTGEALGDVFTSIESLAGSRFADVLRGDHQSNDLFGRQGNDLLIGRGGNDYLNGGAGRDTLDGGAGDDVLRGGDSQDEFIYSSGRDIIEDWNNDIVRINTSQLAGVSHVADLNQFVQVTDAGIMYRFSDNDSLLFLGVTQSELITENVFLL